MHILNFSNTSQSTSTAAGPSNEAEKAGSLKHDTYLLAKPDPASSGFGLKEFQLARVIQAAIIKDEGASSHVKFKYYISYCDENRRLDQWVTSDQVNANPADVSKE